MDVLCPGRESSPSIHAYILWGLVLWRTMANTGVCAWLLSRVRLSCNPMDYSPPGSSVHGISLAIILEWVASSFSRGSSRPRGQTHVSCIAGVFFTTEPTEEDPLSTVFYDVNLKMRTEFFFGEGQHFCPTGV